MSRKRHSVDQIIGKLRQADVELGQGKTAFSFPGAEWDACSRSTARPEPRPPASGGGGRRDGGYLDVVSDERSQTFATPRRPANTAVL